MFKNFKKWIFLSALATNFLSPKFSHSQSSLEKVFYKKDIAKNKLLEGTPLEKKMEKQIEIRAEYSPENKEVIIEIYTENWNKEVEECDDPEYIEKNYLNIRSDSDFYLILPRDNTEFEDIDEFGYFIEKKDGKVFGKWNRLIPADKNPQENLRNIVKGKLLIKALPADIRAAIKETFNYWELKEELSIDDLAESLGKEYEARKIEMYTPEGFRATTNAATKIRIELAHNPEKTQKWLFIYNLNLGSVGKIPGGIYYCNGRLPIRIQGSLERKFEEGLINEKILETLHEEENQEKWKEYLKKIPLDFKKYLPFRDEFPEEFNLYSIMYTISFGEAHPINTETKINLEGLMATYLDRESKYRINVFVSKIEEDIPSDKEPSEEEGIYYNKKENIFYFVNIDLQDPDAPLLKINLPFQKQVQRLNLEKIF